MSRAEGGPSVCSAKMPGERRDYAEGRGRAAGGPSVCSAKMPVETRDYAAGGPSVCSANVPVEPRQRRAEGRPREGRASARPLRPWERVSRLIYYFKGKPGHLNQTILRHLFRLDMANRQRFRQDLYELDYYGHRPIFLYKRHLSAFVYPSNRAEILTDDHESVYPRWNFAGGGPFVQTTPSMSNMILSPKISNISSIFENCMVGTRLARRRNEYDQA